MPAELLRQLAELEKGVKNNLNVSTAEDTDGPQLNNIPYPRNPNFFGREKELTAIGEHLDHVQGDLKFRSLALWGMGGIGKTQIALEYTRKREQDGLGAIFWVHSEKTIDMYQSFTAIAELLDLENRMKEGSGIQNQYLVTKWLQKAQDPNLVRRCWPASQYGSVLITSRNEVVSIDPAEDGLSVPVFSPLEGSQYLYSILKRKAYSDVEKESCEKLAARLDGLPLALTLMGTQIRTKHRKIQRFLDDYNKDYERHHKTPEGGTQNIFYRHSLETAYRTSFDGLNDKPHAAAILAVFSFLAPDSIPEELFEVTDASCLTSDLAFEDALDPLLTSSLITRDSDDGTIRVHRLIQEEFRIYLSQKGGKERQSAFLNAATKLLCAVYPKSVNGLPLRNQWSQCKKYTPHVLALCGRFRELGAINRSSEELGEFMTLLTSCAW
ncbi:hypothetical protein CC80DRAFT_416915 [Byssothecium circinans]|uniref:Uncharacterized protein n=1 Tax=Byssothecium circinans TaxID=147558 RepID=A0A6A5U0W7_9PLEO|nr:hypothetical protein CC80DRAFT_416915 [Byssothecium circinans]